MDSGFYKPYYLHRPRSLLSAPIIFQVSSEETFKHSTQFLERQGLGSHMSLSRNLLKGGYIGELQESLRGILGVQFVVHMNAD